MKKIFTQKLKMSYVVGPLIIYFIFVVIATAEILPKEEFFYSAILKGLLWPIYFLQFLFKG